MNLSELVRTSRTVAGTSARTEKIEHLASFLRRLASTGVVTTLLEVSSIDLYLAETKLSREATGDSR
jgi:hypothetical protein